MLRTDQFGNTHKLKIARVFKRIILYITKPTCNFTVFHNVKDINNAPQYSLKIDSQFLVLNLSRVKLQPNLMIPLWARRHGSKKLLSVSHVSALTGKVAPWPPIASAAANTGPGHEALIPRKQSGPQACQPHKFAPTLRGDAQKPV